MQQRQTETLLKQEFLRRKNRSPSYSLRAFSQAVGVPSGRLSEIFNGKRKLTKQNAQKILDNLKLDLPSRKKWQNSIHGSVPNPKALDEAQFCLISDPIHYALLCLIETNGFEKLKRTLSKEANKLEKQCLWFSNRLGTSKMEVELALQNLKMLKFVSLENDFYFLSVEDGLQTTTDIPSKALRDSHQKSLVTAIEKLNSVPIDRRDITSTTMAVDIKLFNPLYDVDRFGANIYIGRKG